MKVLRVFTVLFVGFHVTHSLRVRSLDRESSAIEYEYPPIIGGERAPEGSSPYHVSLQSLSGNHFCSGAIISSSWILTAAHCLEEVIPEDIQISSGSNDLRGNNSYHFPDEFFRHPYFDEPILHNDIALVHLKSPIQWNDKTQPIQIATEPLLPDSKLLISGWGLTDYSFPQHLQMAEVNYMPYKTCKEIFDMDQDDWIDVGNICTFLTEGVGTCVGDSGAPVVSLIDNTLVGVVNWGLPCANGLPDVHASVVFYHDWVRNTMRG